MGLFGRTVACPICHLPLPLSSRRLEHWTGHAFRISTGRGAGGYTWICSCGPSPMYWDEIHQAGAGLAIHMLDLHQIAI